MAFTFSEDHSLRTLGNARNTRPSTEGAAELREQGVLYGTALVSLYADVQASPEWGDSSHHTGGQLQLPDDIGFLIPSVPTWPFHVNELSLNQHFCTVCIEGLQHGCANLNINPSETIRKGDVLGKYNLMHPKEEWNLVFLITHSSLSLLLA